MMKYVTLMILMAASLFTGQSVYAQQGKCEKEVDVRSEVLVASRGKDLKIKIGMKGGRQYLKSASLKSRGKAPKCMMSLDNGSEHEVDIYVDGVYTGSLRAKTQGVVESSEKYETVYCVSADKKISWTGNGDCNCMYRFKLKN